MYLAVSVYTFRCVFIHMYMYTHVHTCTCTRVYKHTHTHTHTHTRIHRSAFMFYSLEKRPGVKALNPDFGVGKLAQSLAKEWNVLSTPDRQPFASMAQKDKERYVAELKAYKKGLYTGNSPSVRQIASLIRGRPIISGSEGDNQIEVMATGIADKIGGADPGQSPSTDGEEHDLERLCEFYQ